MNEDDGTWHCPKCRFHLHKRLLRATDGAVAIDKSEEREVCPNDGATLLPGYAPDDATEFQCVSCRNNYHEQMMVILGDRQLCVFCADEAMHWEESSDERD